MVDVAKALARPASYTTKYFGCELEDWTSLVNGAHDTAKLAGLLENFIKKYVQCYGCGNPETEIVITKTQMITLKMCALWRISSRLILKNHRAKEGGKDNKAMRRAEKDAQEGAADEEQKKLKRMKLLIKSWCFEEEAMVWSDEDRSACPTYNKVTPNQLQSFLGTSGQPPRDVMTALFEALFGGVGKGFAKEVGKKRKYIAAFVQDEASQLLLLQAIEVFCGKCSAEALKEVALVLKALYDADVLEEESIAQWYEEGTAGGTSCQVLKNVKPFVEWLQTAESEEEE
ncbi:Eukaryotic translation initiation factor 5 [Ananas comosus]|uniref:Eukaryotic translation initiation factor 5 n=1 Tax=Ananas comosus TaxID=4615 RepID=A0A199UP93_ANACO|nr:Eukaryotic translation initiation factor 5 [Ananas comosus]